ncbi:MAG: sigma-70 family RNA polymerase sigma factor [Armatimonadota bacterium]|nr:sigma-70 family RNA polymerase sigma factor [Armatimonadota bacterium]MDR7542879.1 sigma-70 family RNA polymerase sigma factor [Armatimonadota bacterium]
MGERRQPGRPANSEDDRVNFERLVTRYGRRVYAIAYRMTGNEADARDLVQEAFVRVWRAWHRVDPDAQLEGWLYRIVSNLYIDLLRRRRSTRVVSLDEPMATAAGSLVRERADPSADVERLVLDATVDRRIQEALLALPPDLRMVVVLSDVEGHAYEEIAQMIRVPIGTVKSRLHRARRALRDRLSPIRNSLGG